MKLRSISYWENPVESAGYMALYFLILFFSYIPSMLVSIRPHPPAGRGLDPD